MNKEFIPYEQALELKELGYNVQYFGEYFEMDGEKYIVDDKHARDGWWLEHAEELNVNAVLYQQAFKFLREKYNLYPEIIYSARDKKWVCQTSDCIGFELLGWYQTYEEAELACLKKLIEIVKNK
jgi:hypothetical protein